MAQSNLFVPAEDAERARRILEEAEHGKLELDRDAP
jgi:hypothetical protein